MTQSTVLVTGMSGLIGTALRKRLEGRYALRALNRSRSIDGVPCYRADIADLDAITPAFAGVDVVVHLAGYAHGEGTWAEVLDSNITGTYNVFEAALRAGVRRVVYASSGATISRCEREEPWAGLVAGRPLQLGTWPILTHQSPPRPAGLYGVSKVFGETLARHFSDAHGMSMICLRIGAVNAEDRPTAPREFSVWLSQADAVQAIERSIVAPPGVRYAVCFLTSDNRLSYRDSSHAREVLGFVPASRAEDFRR